MQFSHRLSRIYDGFFHVSHQLLYIGASLDNTAAAAYFWGPLADLPRPVHASHGLLHTPQQMPSVVL